MQRISRGAPAKGSPHKGSWGDRYIIENPNRSRRRSCSKCIHYMDDKSCNAKPVYIPEIGYDYWKYCDSFEVSRVFISDDFSENNEKTSTDDVFSNQNIIPENVKIKNSKKKTTLKKQEQTVNNNSKIYINVLENVKICPKCNQACKYTLIEYIKNVSKRKKINVAICPECKNNYIKKSYYDNFITLNQDTNIKFIFECFCTKCGKSFYLSGKGQTPDNTPCKRCGGKMIMPELTHNEMLDLCTITREKPGFYIDVDIYNTMVALKKNDIVEFKIKMAQFHEIAEKAQDELHKNNTLYYKNQPYNVDGVPICNTQLKKEKIYEYIPGILHNVYILQENTCPCCNKKLSPYTIKFQRKINNIFYEQTIKCSVCNECGREFVNANEIKSLNYYNTAINFNKKYYNVKYNNEKYNCNTIVIFDINKCSKHNHKIENLLCDLPIITNNGDIKNQQVEIVRCKTCNKYIMLKSIYNNLQGVPVCSVINETRNEANGYTENDFYYGEGAGTKLFQYGYNVNCNDKLTVKQRQKILLLRLLTKDISQDEIYSILDTNIDRGNNREDSQKDWSNAIEKWKMDKAYVKQLDLEAESKKIDVNKIILNFRQKV